MRRFWRKRETDPSFGFARLSETDELAASTDINELNNLIVQFGQSLLNVSPGDISRLSAAVENDDSEEIREIVGNTNSNNTSGNQETEFKSIDMVQESFFKMAVRSYKTKWVEFFVDKIANKSIPFTSSASMIKESSNDPWLDYRSFLEDMMTTDVLGWDVCTIEVPVETFTVDSNLGARVGTCNTILDWIHCSSQGTSFEHWRSLNKKQVNKLMRKTRGRKVNATVRIYCFEDACQIGLDGIVRFLLMHKAPSHLFKTPLIKWVVTYKWERIWKVLAFKRLVSFLVLFVGFHIFALFVSFEDFFPIPEACRLALTYFVFIVLVLLPILVIRREYFQVKRCLLDGRRIFPSNWFRGIGIYFESRSSLIDLMLSVLILVMFAVVGLTIANIHIDVANKVLHSTVAVAVLFMWAKAFYLTQAFKKSGMFVVMIRRVLQECAAYFLMLLGIMISFGFAMRVAFVEYAQKPEYALFSKMASIPKSSSNYQHSETLYAVKDALEDESEQRVHTSFGSLYRTILTMAYAMVGLFDPEVLFLCNYLPGLMIALFLTYLILQSIVMFNMLIASMGDAFDGVRAAEEELFLMARARFIDQYEASLSNKAIRKMKAKIGRYLYVLMPEDKPLEDSVPFWKGRIPTIKEDVQSIVMESQIQISQNTREMFKTLMDEIKGFKDDIKGVNEDIKDFKDDINGLKEQVKTLEQRITEQDSNRFFL